MPPKVYNIWFSSEKKTCKIVYSAQYFKPDKLSYGIGWKVNCYLHRYCSQLVLNNLTLLFCRKFPKATDNGFIYIYKSPFIANTKDTAESVALRSILLCKYQSTAEALAPKSITHVVCLEIFHPKYGYS